MSCPTCSHTLAPIMQTPDGWRCFHCERCGTMVTDRGNETVKGVYTPKLVERCKDFRAQAAASFTARQNDLWITLGIAESIRPEGER